MSGIRALLRPALSGILSLALGVGLALPVAAPSARAEQTVLSAAKPLYRDLTSRALIERRVAVRGGATGEARVVSPGDALDRASAQRRTRGLGVLRSDARLRAAAQRHAEWMARNGVMAHRGAGGERFTARVARAGYGRLCFGAENVAYGQRDGAEVVAAWMASPPHRRAMLDPRAHHAAVAKAVDGRGQTYWTMLVAQPC